MTEATKRIARYSRFVNLWSFLTAGGAALAGSYKSGNTTTTWVPLTDINGSTIALVNSALPSSPPAATYTYDPSGNVSINGSNVTSWPFQYQGMEHELTDPANLYFNPSSNVYNPQIQNALSQVGAQGLGGSSGANPDGPGVSRPSGQSGGLTWQKFQNDVRQSEQIEDADNNFSISFTDGEAAPVTLPLGAIAGTADLLVNLIEDLFSGAENPPIPRQLMHKRHPLYEQILGIDAGIIPTEGSVAGGVLVLAQAKGSNSGDDPDLNLSGDALDAEIRRLSQELRSMPSGAARSKLQRKIRELSRRKSKRAHGADQHSKFSWIPIIPEAPLASEGGFALPEVTDILIDAAAALAF
jgi:hypothetical protein